MESCKKCIHKPVCFKQNMMDEFTPKGFELSCPHFKSKVHVAEVVRCKECRFKHDPEHCALYCAVDDKTAVLIEHGDDFYCSFGERGDDK